MGDQDALSSQQISPSRILVAGPTEAGKKRLVHSLLSYETMIATRQTKEVNMEELLPATQQQDIRWDISTKYYTASLHLHVVHTSALGEASVVEGEAEGIILVFDATRQESFEEIKPWGPMAVSQGAELRLCVGTKADLLKGSKTHQDMIHERMGWCLDHGFEYVEVDLVRPTVGSEDREKEGFPRVMESIYSTRWQSMALLPQQAPPKKDKECHGPGPEALYQVLQEASEGFEGDVDELDMIFERIREVRSSAGSLSDGERRMKAAETAMRLARVLGIEEDEDDEQEGGYRTQARED